MRSLGPKAVVAFYLLVVAFYAWSIWGQRRPSGDGMRGPEGLMTTCWDLAPEPCMDRAKVALDTYRSRGDVPQVVELDINEDGRDLVCIGHLGSGTVCFRPDAAIPTQDALQVPSG
ncbi:MAG: hypothetical protein U0869_09015 [Chloroflexota bacterium]